MTPICQSGVYQMNNPEKYASIWRNILITRYLMITFPYQTIYQKRETVAIMRYLPCQILLILGYECNYAGNEWTNGKVMPLLFMTWETIMHTLLSINTITNHSIVF